MYKINKNIIPSGSTVDESTQSMYIIRGVHDRALIITWLKNMVPVKSIVDCFMNKVMTTKINGHQIRVRYSGFILEKQNAKSFCNSNSIPILFIPVYIFSSTHQPQTDNKNDNNK